MTPSDSAVEARGLRFHVRIWPGAGRLPFVLVHGLASTARIWDFTAPILAEGGHRVVALDQRGHGETDQPESGYDLDSVSDDLRAVLDATGIHRDAVLVGHSWGASVVLRAAARFPALAAGIALVDGGLVGPGGRGESWEQAAERMRPPDLDGQLYDDLATRMGRGALAAVADDPRLDAFRRSLFRIDSEGRVYRRLSIPHHMLIARSLWEFRPRESLAEVACPVLALPAREAGKAASDWNDLKAAEVAAAQRAFPDRVQVQWFEDTIHDVPLQRPDELAGRLLAFAASLR